METHDIQHFVRTLQSMFALSDDQTRNLQTELQYLPPHTPIFSNYVDMHALDHNIARALGVSLGSDLHANVINYIQDNTLTGYVQKARPVEYIVSNQRLVDFYSQNEFSQQLVNQIEAKMQEFLNYHVSRNNLSTAENMQDMTWLQQQLSRILHGMEHYFAGIVQAALIGVKLEPFRVLHTLNARRRTSEVQFRVII